MNEIINPEVEPKEENITLGDVLKKSRVNQGLSEQDVADSLNLKKDIILALEANDFEKISVATYTKGYIKAYAKLLALNESELLQMFYQQQPVEHHSQTKLKSFSQRTKQEAHDNRLMFVTYLILFIVVALIVVWWWQRENLEQTETISLNHAANSIEFNLTHEPYYQLSPYSYV
ncbi:helix-turn-helix domain-containing protein [Catenovulum sediminis]|uniref:helix-turn-helix domain-containing protein n=1 Tax=Catenovulum sediminis TaxID=1740262 RepID=UPI00117D3BBF|nr:helix-turn-helix domain-containing protein [Catenovulum sediminis]